MFTDQEKLLWQEPLDSYSSAVMERLESVLYDRVELPWPLTAEMRLILLHLGTRLGRQRAISRSDLAQLVGRHDREVREMIRSLRQDFGIAIGSNRDAGHSGYYLVSCAEEAEELTSPLIAQAISIFRLVKALRGRHATAELFGQARIALDLPTESEATHG